MCLSTFLSDYLCIPPLCFWFISFSLFLSPHIYLFSFSPYPALHFLSLFLILPFFIFFFLLSLLFLSLSLPYIFLYSHSNPFGLYYLSLSTLSLFLPSSLLIPIHLVFLCLFSLFPSISHFPLCHHYVFIYLFFLLFIITLDLCHHIVHCFLFFFSFFIIFFLR